ncbi:MAG TPA: PilN domain-containing protein [Candidatus Methylomirabilis sp.]|nr:PilN domain-containing protein [Candidatus Methylomirabilis sp.]
MLRLNLLAEDSKQKIRYKRLNLLFRRTEIYLIIFLAIIAVLFFGARQILQNNYQKSSATASQMLKVDNNQYSIQAKEINNKLSAVSEIENSYLSYSQLIKKITDLIPAGVTVSYLKIDSEQKRLLIRGIAATRDNLLNLENNLTNSSFLSDVNVPLQEKLKKENIDIDINMQFDPAKISL